MAIENSTSLPPAEISPLGSSQQPATTDAAEKEFSAALEAAYNPLSGKPAREAIKDLEKGASTERLNPPSIWPEQKHPSEYSTLNKRPPTAIELAKSLA